MTVSCGTTAKLTNLQDYSLDYLASPTYRGVILHRQKKALPKQCFFLLCRQPRDNQRHNRLTAGQNTARFVIALLPVGLIHAGNRHTAAGGCMNKLVVADVNADVSTG